MYYLAKNIRIRKCDDLTFAINVSNNAVFTMKTKAFNYIESLLKYGINKDEITFLNNNVIDFIYSLESNGIIEVSNEN